MEVSSSTEPHQVSKPSFLNRLVCGKRLTVSLGFLAILIFLSVVSPLFAQDSQTVVARVGKEEITQKELDDSVLFKILPLEQQLYALRKAALQNLIIRKLLESEASRKGVPVDQLRQEFMAGPVNVPANQVEDLYRQNLNVFALFSADEAKEKLRLDLEGQTRLKRYREAVASLRKSYPVEVLLSEPRWSLLYNSSASFKGPADARVVITEFADFQCGYCKEVQPTLKQLLQIYPNDIQLNFRALASPAHPMSVASIEAARCAGKQGSFWAFHDALFESSPLSPETFGKLAKDLKLNLGEFEHCLSSGEMRSGIDADWNEAQRLGINATPTFLINGRLLTGAASLQEFKSVVEQELNRLQPGFAN
jgi:protein-disulfide isomerase